MNSNKKNNKELGIKRVYTAKQKKYIKTNRILLVVAAVLFITGVVLILIEPIKNYKRKSIINNAVTDIKSQIAIDATVGSDATVPQFTMIVDRDANPANGEDYDYFGDDAQQEEQRRMMEEALANLPQDVTLNCIGLIQIESVGIEEPIWDNDTVVDLRYGTGHHQTSVMPGEDGNCTILGHRMRSTGTIFNRLNEVVIGDSIVITTIDGSVFVYTVDNIMVIDPVNLEDYIDADDGEGTQITLVTCEYTDAGKMRLIIVGHMTECTYSQAYINSLGEEEN